MLLLRELERMIKTIAHVNLALGFRGGERQTFLHIKFLQKEFPHLQQILICNIKSELPKYLKDEVPSLKIIKVKNELFGHLKVANSIDLVQAHEAKGVHWAGLHYALYKTPYFITRRVPQRIKNTVFNRFIYRHLEKAVSVSQAISNVIVDSLGEQVNLDNKLAVVYDALAHMEADQVNVEKIKQEYAGKKVIGHIGAYVDRHKGQKVLIDAARLYLKKYPETVFLFLGKGKDEAELRALSADVPQIKWLGFKTNIADYTAALDIFAFPSRNEGLGSVLLDIMDYNIPIVASRVDGIPEIVKDGETGLLFENDNAQQLAECLIRLTEDKELSVKLVKQAQERLDNFTPECMARNYYKLYEESLNKKK